MVFRFTTSALPSLAQDQGHFRNNLRMEPGKVKSLRIYLLETIGPVFQWVRRTMLSMHGYSNIADGVIIERGVRLDKVYPEHIHIGTGTLVASSVTILCHEHVYRDPVDRRLPLMKEVRIGERCFIGVSAMILPGVTIGDECIIGAGSIVCNDIPSGSLAVGVPARVVRSNLRLDHKAIAL
jgi:acetyltransferase-like isoleucine patch superfamily enzyme